MSKLSAHDIQDAVREYIQLGCWGYEGYMQDVVQMIITHLESGCVVDKSEETELVLLGIGVHGPGLPVVLELYDKGKWDGLELLVAVLPLLQTADLAPQFDGLECRM